MKVAVCNGENYFYESYPLSTFKSCGDSAIGSENNFAPWSQLIDNFIRPVMCILP